jgi:hypothetical protein
MVASRTAEERAQLERVREVQREKMRRVIDREMAVATREKAVTRKEMEVELKERSAHHTINTAKAMEKTIDDERAALSLRRWPSRRRRPASPPIGQTWRPGPGTSRSGRPRRRDSWRSSTPGSTGS